VQFCDDMLSLHVFIGYFDVFIESIALLDNLEKKTGLFAPIQLGKQVGSNFCSHPGVDGAYRGRIAHKVIATLPHVQMAHNQTQMAHEAAPDV